MARPERSGSRSRSVSVSDVNRLIQFRQIELDLDLSGSMWLDVYTDQRGDDLQVKLTATIDTESTTAGRRRLNVRLPGNVRGYLVQVAIRGNAEAIIYGARIEGKILGNERTDWQWFPLPVVPTSEQWSVGRLPLAGTPDTYSVARLPIRPTSEDWSIGRLPIRPTGEDWGMMSLPLPRKASEGSWVSLPVDPE